jgi:hypothetical protein
MSTIAGQINDQITAGRRTIERSLNDVKDLEMPDVPPVAIAAGVAAALMAFGVLGWLIYRSRRRRTIVERLQEAVPDGVRELPQGLRDQVRRVR